MMNISRSLTRNPWGNNRDILVTFFVGKNALKEYFFNQKQDILKKNLTPKIFKNIYFTNNFKISLFIYIQF